MTERDSQFVQSTAKQPDLDWSQVRETVRMLHLAVAQIKIAMREGDDSVDTLTHSFTSMTGNVNLIAQAAASLSGETAEVANIGEKIEQNCRQVSDQMHSAIIAFQFYDKLSQRLDHVNGSLASLAELVEDQQRLYKPHEWKGLQENIRSFYTMPEEVEMFNAVLNGADIKQAVHHCEVQRRANKTEDDDIELF